MQEGCLRKYRGQHSKNNNSEVTERTLSQYNSGTTATVGNIGKTNQK